MKCYELQFEVVFTKFTERAEETFILSCLSYNCFPDAKDWRNIINQIFDKIKNQNMNFISVKFDKSYQI